MRLLAPSAVLLALCAGCGDGVTCTADFRFTLSGVVRGESGDEINPDEVLVRPENAPERKCQLRPPGGYVCPEGPSGRAQVLVRLGDRTWTQSIRIRDEPDGCHNAAQELDFVLDGITACEPRAAVSGAIVGAGGGPLPATVSIHLVRPEDANSDSASVACEIRGQRYACPAISDHTTDYRLVLQVRGSVREFSVRVPAEGCAVSPVQHDLVAI